MPFKQGLSAQWYCADDECLPNIPPTLNAWLFDSASLTKRLSSQCAKFEVVLLEQSNSVVSLQERNLFDEHSIECREVLLLCDGVAQVYARTLLPQATLAHANKRLKTLGNTSLGDVLFNDPSMRRSTIEVCEFGECSTLAVMSQQLLRPKSGSIWGRRSMFYLQDYPLSVAEFFLPGGYANTKNLL